MKKITALLLVLCMLLAAVPAMGEGPSGNWYMTLADVSLGYILLNEDGTANLNIASQTEITGTWTMDGDSVTITAEGEPLTFAYDGTSLKMKVNIRLEHNRTCEPHALRHYQMTATFLGESSNSFLESLRIESHTITHGTELLQIHGVVRDDGSAHLRHLERQFLRILLVRIYLCLSRDCYGQEHHTH